MKQLEKVRNCYDLTAAEYTKKFSGELFHKPLDRLLLKRFADENKDKGIIADLGCGCGHTTKFLKDSGVGELIGIDLSPAMIRQASQTNEDIKFEVGNMLDLRVQPEEFAAVLAFYSIVHFIPEELEKAFAEIHRVLKPFGQFLFSFHVGDEETHLDEFLDQKVDVTFYFFEVDAILQILGNAGFRVIDAAIRYPYQDFEYPSKRAYITAEKQI
jgi:ubiquinone/menaquinone biosynthesis C-methylase UbiE